ncbi:MAG: adenosylmethionine decarboxylase [Lentisphaeria bacterium]|nr:adenosylmethionine decarboxylase [Lentisphaeria bacterium]
MMAPQNRCAGGVALGRQMTVEFYDCSAAVLADAKRMETIFLEAAKVSGAHVVNSTFHAFEPQGVSGVVVISESHFAVHAWPEHDYAAVDLFTCGPGVDFDAAIRALGQGMKSGHWIVSSLVNRGILRESGELERLVPVVENERSRGLQLSWKERFDHSGAGGLSACIDIYRCRKLAGLAETDWRGMTDMLAEAAGLRGEQLETGWRFTAAGQDADFTRSLRGGRIAGFVCGADRRVYLDVFVRGFFDPRAVAEAAVSALGGTYYRMQPQIRQ